MSFVNKKGYVCRRKGPKKKNTGRLSLLEREYNSLDWYLGKPNLDLRMISLPVKYHGKRIKIKIVQVKQ